VTHPEQGSSESPSNQDPHAQGPPPSSPWYPPGVAPVPQQPQEYGPSPGYPVQQPYQGQPGYPPQQGYPVPGHPYDPTYAGLPYAPPPKRRNGLLIGLVAVLVVLCLAGTALGGIFAVRAINAGKTTSPTTGPATTAAPSTETGSNPSSAPVQGFNGNLNQLLVPRPSGSQPWKDFAVKDGTILTLSQMANLFSDEKEMTNDLGTYKYQRGVANHWSKNDVFVLLLLFQFDSSVDAQKFVQSTKTSGLDGYEAKGTFSNITGSLSFVDETPNADGQRSIIFISAKKEIVSYATIWYPGAIDTAGATALAVQQYGKLP
jgi:hypothetical protein